MLAGWVFDVTLLKTVVPGWTAMVPNTALCFILSGTALFWGGRAAVPPAGAVALIGYLTVAEYLFGVDLAIDRLLPFPDALRMAPTTAASFSLLGTACLTLERQPSRAQALAFAAMLIALLGGLGYLLRAEQVFEVGGLYTTMAIHTAFTMLVLGAGVLWRRPDAGPMAIVSREGPAGTLARRLIPAAAGTIVALGTLWSLGHDLGWFDWGFALAGLVASSLAVIVALVWWSASALGDREDQFRRLFDASLDAIGIRSLRSGKIVAVNRQFQEVMGYSQEELVGRSAIELGLWVRPEDASSIVAEVSAGKSVLSREVAFRTKAGESRVGLVSATVGSFDGEPAVIFATRDVTERKRREDQFRQLLDAAPDAGVIVDLQGRIVLVNAETERLFGYSRAELVGQPIETLVPERFRTAHADRRAEYSAAPKRRGMGVGLNLFARRKDGTEIPVEISLAPIESPEGTLVSASIRDMTARREADARLRDSEARFRALAMAAPIGIIQTDANGHTTYANPRWCELTGLTADHALGDGWLATVHAEDRDRVWQAWRACVQTGGSASWEHRIVRADGTERWVLANASASRAPDGSVLGFVRTLEDVSERKAIEQMRRDLIRMLSHDLKNPLGLVLGHAQIMRDQVGAGTALADSIDGIESGARQALALTGNFLDADQIESGVFQVRKAKVSLGAIVESVAREFSAKVRLSGVRLETRLDSTLPPLDGDEPLLERVVTNLMSNAFKFSPSGGVVEIETRRSEGGVLLEVRDRGPGIPPDEMPKLFRRYARGVTKRRDSTGLGLFIVRTIVDAHGGRVAVECPPGGGSTFRVWLPLAETPPRS